MGLFSAFDGSGFGTFIFDAYTVNEKWIIADALEEICSSTDSYGWASTGIYSFWEYPSKNLLYIGKSVDLPNRFRQHNGLIPSETSDNKKDEIDKYFKSARKLGFSIFVQSSLSQSYTSRNRRFLNQFELYDEIDSSSRADISIVEGNFLEAFRTITGEYPSWNNIGGMVLPSELVYQEIYNYLLDPLSGKIMGNLVSMSSIRELSESSLFTEFEIQLHGVRMLMLHLGMEFEHAIIHLKSNFPGFSLTLTLMEEFNYLNKHLEI